MPATRHSATKQVVGGSQWFCTKAKRIILIVYIEKGQARSSEYIAHLFDQVDEQIQTELVCRGKYHLPSVQ